MAISPTGAMFKSLTFGGVDSADYGIYISGDGVYNSPNRAVEMVSVPGRNGDIPIDAGHWENIEVEYTCGTFAQTQEEFRANFSAFRNAIASQIGYQRLSDSYHPDEYREALFIEGIEVDPSHYSSAGGFSLVFNCKPQRFLTDGEETRNIMSDWGNLKTGDGDIVTFEVDGNEARYTRFKSLTATIEPIQAGEGTPSPDNVRPISGWDSVDVHISPTESAEDGTTHTATFEETVYGGTVDLVSGVLTVDRAMVDLGALNWGYEPTMQRFYSTTFLSDANGGFNSGICSQYEYSPSPIAGTRLDSTIFIYAANKRVYVNDSRYTTGTAFKTAMSGVQLVYELATPQTYQLTPQTISTLEGVNNVWASSGAVSVEYGTVPWVLINPTQYDSQPLLAVEGYGSFSFNGSEITIENVVMGEIDIADSLNSGLYFDTDKVNEVANVGDLFTVDFWSRYGWRRKSGGGSITSASVAGSPSNGNVVVTRTSNQVTFDYYPSSGAVYTWGTASEKTIDTFTVRIGWASSSGADMGYVTISYTVKLNYRIDSYGSNSLFLVAGDSGASDSFLLNFDRISRTCSVTSCILDSSVSILGHPTYIDCELGDAYKVSNGETILLNSYIALGSALPTLSPGANEFTMDDTITDLQIVPRWWRL